MFRKAEARRHAAAMASRRGFLGAALALFGGVSIPHTARANSSRLLIQDSPLAGFQYHAGESVWSWLEPGATLSLVREKDNPFDPNATRVEWRGRKLGYVPAMENTAVAQMLDRGQTLHARITRLVSSRNPWERIRFEVEAA